MKNGNKKITETQCESEEEKKELQMQDLKRQR